MAETSLDPNLVGNEQHLTPSAEPKILPSDENAPVSLEPSDALQQLIDKIQAAEGPQKEIDRLKIELDQLFKEELGNAEYDDLSETAMKNGKAFMKLYDKPAQAVEFVIKTAKRSTLLTKFADFLTERSRKKHPVESKFGIYADLNLDGANDETRKASRFAHLIFAESDSADFLTQDPSNLAHHLQEVFTNPEHKFKWIAKDGSITTEDPRIDQLDFNAITVLDYKDGVDIPTQSEAQRSPLIIRIHDEHGENQLIDPTLQTSLQHLIDRHPFVIMVSQPRKAATDDNPHNQYLFNILGNHQYLDGVPAAYYLNKLIQQSGLKSIHLDSVPRDTLRDTFEMTDKRENTLAPDDRYDIESVILSDKLQDTFQQLYENVSTEWKKKGVTISDKDFFQLALFHFQQINGENRRAGVLKFNANITEQLGHYDVGDARKMFDLLCTVSASKGSLIEAGVALRKQHQKDPQAPATEVVDLYPESLNNVHNIIGSLTDAAPRWSWPWINTLTKKSKILDYIIGQSMSSIVPEQISVRYGPGPSTKIDLGGGCGGPACTETQKWCCTAALFHNRFAVVRIKRRKPREKDNG